LISLSSGFEAGPEMWLLRKDDFVAADFVESAVEANNVLLFRTTRNHI
jgi:hypothetical protein